MRASRTWRLVSGAWLALLPAARIAAQLPAGQWVGGLTVGKEWRFIKLRLPADSSGTASLDLPRPDACTMGLPLQRVERSGPRVRFAVQTERGVLGFDGVLQSDSTLRGTVARGDERGTFRLARLVQLDPQSSKAYAGYVGNYQTESGRTLLVTEIDGVPVYLDSLRFTKLHALSETTFFTDDGEQISFVRDSGGQVSRLRRETWDGRRSEAARVARYREERITYPGEGVSLGGTVITPFGRGPHPAVVMVHGSNVQPREGYRFLGADYFARHGIAALIYDKRGVGESSGNWRGASFDALAGDALAGIRLLKSRADIDSSRIGLYGISQGGWIIPLAASRSPDVAFLISVSGNVIMPWEQETLRQLAEMRARGVPDAVVAQADTTWNLFFRLLRSGAGTQPADSAIERLRGHGVPSPPKSTAIGPTAWFKYLDPFFDPISVLRRVRQPILWLFGEVDLITPPKPNLERLEPLLRGDPRPDYTIKVFPRANHIIWLGQTGSGLEIPCLREYASGYFSTMADWIRRVHPGGR